MNALAEEKAPRRSRQARSRGPVRMPDGQPEIRLAYSLQRVKPQGPIALAICAWCGKWLGARRGMSGITHGICPSCKREMLHGLGPAENVSRMR